MFYSPNKEDHALRRILETDQCLSVELKYIYIYINEPSRTHST
jgi:hypothetical protein